MKAISLSLHNFRSFADVCVDLDDFFVLAGANNAGKSNIMDAIRVFYEDEKYLHYRDFPKFTTKDEESWIEIGFKLSEEEWQGLKKEYQQRTEEKVIVVRKVLESGTKKQKPGLYFVDKSGKLHETLFYGAKNVQQAKLGRIIYIPAVSKLGDLTKMTGPSPLREIVNLVLKKVLSQGEAYEMLQASLSEFENSIRAKEEARKDEVKDSAGDLSLHALEQRINNEIASWGIQFRFRINSLSIADIVRNLIGHTLREKRLGDAELPQDVYGHGFQRYLIFALIKVHAELKSFGKGLQSAKRKDFSPDFTWLLFEEPEAFLHPSQIVVLSATLRSFASEDSKQVLISTHNPLFLSRNMGDLTAFARLTREGAMSKVKQITLEKLESILSQNQEEVKKWTKFDISPEDLDVEMESIKYALWLDERRASGFFAEKVLLVEGPTEVALFNYLIQEGHLPAGQFYVFDSLGKFNMHRFMNLFGELGIGHAVLYDKDVSKPKHQEVNETIERAKNDSTIKIKSFEDDLEAFLGIPKVKHKHRKPQHVMYHVRKGKVSPEKLAGLAEMVRDLLAL